ncbi:hypothetical protein F0P96_00385 [Hymenobacter busanensis]|uniref:Uncharacterized protein n=1 Tax=Hymenobacter busanensis TaxID=2607656 RepID=A0A7L4ZVU9_9BACT|nr:hypothetical protein [Hymenobacter busanensis]KAA9339125.1 hypothetical protein F0P96_00385 [Hymenobacter busanensis]QHJ07113.1 hypothetical protein GUY19_07365 [Hymenobacter busanensis]
MPAILPGYEYDIFISYRHNDNLFDGWVTEFVNRLQEELAATLKDRLSIYFDRNLKDGLGDTHHVDESLRHRVKALILIPLISQTYCDTERYSWKHEFLPFKQQASTDALGMYLRLPSGNMGCRILPLRIHQIDAEDVQLLEQELNGHLRSIDFIYEGLGVNRPLRLKDDELPTPGQTLYRNQINKVANAIKELIAGIKQAHNAAVPAAPVFTRSATPTPSFTAPPSVATPAADAPLVFLPWTAKELNAKREELALICTKAGLKVTPSTDCPLDEDEFRARTREALAAATCAVHILGSDFGRRFEDNEDQSFPQYAYDQACLLADAQPGFKQFVWFCPTEGMALRAAQEELIGRIRNELTENRTFSSVPTAMQFVEDLRSQLQLVPPAPLTIDKDTDIFFVYNQQDLEEATAITDRLSEEFPLELLTIEPDSEDLYKNITVDTIPRSKLAVVYFKYSADWALPFVKQVWRLVGGAASTTPILLLGEDDPAMNRMRVFKAPRVTSSVLAHQRISEEIRRVYLQLQNLN